MPGGGASANGASNDVIEKEQTRAMNRVFTYGAAAVALALILCLPPALFHDMVSRVDQSGIIAEQRLPWFIVGWHMHSEVRMFWSPDLSSWLTLVCQPEQSLYSLWIGEMVVWLILSVALYLTARGKRLRLGPATLILAAIVVVSATMPAKRMQYSPSTPNRYVVFQRSRRGG